MTKLNWMRQKWVIFKSVCLGVGLIIIIVSLQHGIVDVENPEMATPMGLAYALGIALAMFSSISLLMDYGDYVELKKQKKITDFKRKETGE